jgi:hypothetical protein
VTVRHMATLAGPALVAGCGRVVGSPAHEPAHDAISREEVLGPDTGRNDPTCTYRDNYNPPPGN